jgi:hypothetical protein
VRVSNKYMLCDQTAEADDLGWQTCYPKKTPLNSHSMYIIDYGKDCHDSAWIMVG